jgi:hypothetical protein
MREASLLGTALRRELSPSRPPPSRICSSVCCLLGKPSKVKILRTIYSSSPHSRVHLMRLFHVLVEPQGGRREVRRRRTGRRRLTSREDWRLRIKRKEIALPQLGNMGSSPAACRCSVVFWRLGQISMAHNANSGSCIPLFSIRC